MVDGPYLVDVPTRYRLEPRGGEPSVRPIEDPQGIWVRAEELAAHDAFYRLVVLQRDLAWKECDMLRAEKLLLVEHLKQAGLTGLLR